jgi:predicted nucleic acid-binding protein
VTILDASALINLINGGVLGKVLNLPNRSFAVGPQVLGECATHREIIDPFLGQALRVLSDDELSASLFFSLLERYELGIGETECLTLADQYDGGVCTDDRKARNMCTSKIGSDRVLGSVRLLREAVSADLLSPEEAIQAYQTMKARGAFLPDVPSDYFLPD